MENIGRIFIHVQAGITELCILHASASREALFAVFLSPNNPSPVALPSHIEYVGGAVIELRMLIEVVCISTFWGRVYWQFQFRAVFRAQSLWIVKVIYRRVLTCDSSP